ncbi:MAG: carboxynorspermidine decarboxylase [Saprospiraceae bacterium]|nr:carboxynorspermidine decarboxylase [Saprospiraceae bacterium]
MDYTQIKGPAFVLDEQALENNLSLIQKVRDQSGVQIILALKGFAMWKVFPKVFQYLNGATASSLYEARLIFEEMGTKAHTYCVAYRPEEFEELCSYSSHMTFNSIKQFNRFIDQLKDNHPEISPGIRVNPEYSEVETELYNPAAPGSRLGEVIDNFGGNLPAGVEGLHFHTLCESSSYDLEKTLAVFETKFGKFFPFLKWVNFGGGHLMTRKGYDTEHLVNLLRAFKERYPHLEVILEPGSAIAWDTGPLVANVLDIHKSHGIQTLILDVSFTAHMPDTLEMPYRPKVRGAGDPVEGKPTYRLGGTSCLAGDYMFEYSFTNEVQVGDKIILEDMMHYTMVKTTMFNGVHHPDICIWTKEQKLETVRKFSYEDYKNRLS